MEEIGSGIYNINKYLPLYAPGRKATFNEDIIFTTTIPIPDFHEAYMTVTKKTTPHDGATPHDVTPHDATPQVIKLLNVLEKNGEMSREELLVTLDLKDREHLRKGYLKPALKSGLIELTIPAKLKSKKQKYRVTEKGLTQLKIPG